MDEKYIDILIYGVVLVISAVGMYNKARKQRQRQSGSPSGPNPWKIEDDEEVRPVRPEPVQAENPTPPRPATPEISARSAARRQQGATVDRTVGEMIAVEGGRSTRHADSKVEETKTTPAHKEDEHAAPLADFDLRKAIIYSEILKPKFDEF